MVIALNGTVTMYCNLLTDIRIAKETGYQGIEIIGSKLYRFLDEGFDLNVVKKALEDLPVVALGYVQDLERTEVEEHHALLKEAEKICVLAEKLGCPTVQVLTGPLIKGGPYKGHPHSSRKELLSLSAKNMKEIAGIARTHHLSLYLEPLNWAPVSSLEDSLELIELSAEDNVGLVIDFWHMWCAGVTAESVAKLDKRYIRGVHFCDSSETLGVRSPDHTQPSRQVWTGGGLIPLKEWVDAVKSTGYDGWWSPELFSSKHWELDPWDTAVALRQMLEYLMY
jgi:sugar phosphate isomerase/epimerase